jgi:hypothetical protein
MARFIETKCKTLKDDAWEACIINVDNIESVRLINGESNSVFAYLITSPLGENGVWLKMTWAEARCATCAAQK